MSEPGIGAKIEAICGLVADKIIAGDITDPDDIVSSLKVLVNYYAIKNKLGLADAEGAALAAINEKILGAAKEKEKKNANQSGGGASGRSAVGRNAAPADAASSGAGRHADYASPAPGFVRPQLVK